MSKMLFSFKGRINRKPYWMMLLVVLIGTIVTSVIDMVTTGTGIASILFTLIIAWSSLAIQVKRWHDRDKSGWWVLISIIPIVGTIWAIIVNGFLTGTEGTNRFGDNPLGNDKVKEKIKSNKLKNWYSNINKKQRIIVWIISVLLSATNPIGWISLVWWLIPTLIYLEYCRE